MGEHKKTDSGTVVTEWTTVEMTDEAQAVIDRPESHCAENAEWYARHKDLKRRFRDARTDEKRLAIHEEIQVLNAAAPKDKEEVWQEWHNMFKRLNSDQARDADD